MIPSATVVRTAIALMRFTPVPVARALAAAGGTLAWAVQHRRRRALLRSLVYTAPDRTPRERRRLARRTFRNMAVAAVDQFRLPTITPEELRSLFEVRGLEHVDAAQAMGRGTIIVTAHLGPYELAAAWLAAMGYPVYAMVENLAPAIYDALAAYRSATGMQLVNMKDGIRAAYRILGEGSIMGLVADRAIGEARSAVTVPFAGGMRRVPTGPAVFAQATGAPIVTGFVSLNPRGTPRYLIEIDPPIIPAGRDAAERDRLIRSTVERIVAAVRRNPDQWFVFQPDWIPGESA